MENTELARQALAEIIEHFRPTLNGRGQVEFLDVIAAKLNRVDGSANWGWRYVQSVQRGTVEPGKRMVRAIMALAAALDDVPVEIARAEIVQVNAAPGKVRPGAYVMGESRVCARPGCGLVFVPNVPWRKFCINCK